MIEHALNGLNGLSFSFQVDVHKVYCAIPYQMTFKHNTFTDRDPLSFMSED